MVRRGLANKFYLIVAMTATLVTFSAEAKLIPKDVRTIGATRETLQLPLLERLSALRDQGERGYINLLKIANDRNESMEDRWRAITAVARIAGNRARPELEKALKSPDWFVRNAVLIAIKEIDGATAVAWAKRLLDDKALVVRAAAVEILGEYRDLESVPVLWQKLYASENFKNGQSLFIRRRIVEILAGLETQGREGKFIALLSDNDVSLHPPAIQALERITKQRFGGEREPLKFKKAHWEQWWKEQKATM